MAKHPQSNVPVTALQEIGESIKLHLPEILDDWQTTATEEPWLSLPSAYKVDNLAEVIRVLVDAALGEGDRREARLNKVREAAKHGQDRMEMGFAEHVLFLEYYLLRQSLWHFVEQHHSGSATNVIMRLDAAITLATTASLRGYHKATFESRGEWPQAVEQLADR